MNVAVLYSGGKDSNFSLLRATREHTVKCLITLEPNDEDSMLFHYPNVGMTRLQALSLGLPHLYTVIPKGQDELKALAGAVSKAKEEFGLEGVVTGAVKSKYQKFRFEDVFDAEGLDTINPAWGVNEETYLYVLLREGLRFIMTSVAALGLGREWLGRTFDQNAVDDLLRLSKTYRFNPSLEGGEGETLVLDMPLFGQRIEIQDSEVVWLGDRGFLKIKSAYLREKAGLV